MAASGIIIIVLTLQFVVVKTTIFTSSHKLDKMAVHEDRVLSALRELIEEKHNELIKISDTYLKLSHESRLRPRSQVADDTSHPNAAYYVIKRFAVDYNNRLGESSYASVASKLENDPVDPMALASREDYDGAIQGLLRLQSIYNLTVEDMLKGNYSGHLGPALDFDDAYWLGRTAFSIGLLPVASACFDAALDMRRVHPGAINTRMFPTDGAIKGLKGRTLILQREIEEARKVHAEAELDDPINGDVLALGKEVVSIPVYEAPLADEARQNYSRLCQHKDDYVIERPDYRAMKCRYKAGLLPYYVFREEILSLSPFVSLFYHVFSERERGHLMDSSKAKLSRGLVKVDQQLSNETSAVSQARTSDVGWLRDADSAMTASMSKRVGVITGLSVTPGDRNGHPMSGEEFQVVNYGLAGHYDIHLDPFNAPDGSGYRIATFLVYLNSVAEGGNTVFTQAGISVAARKDTVLFWYSFPPSFDQVDDKTQHAGCPVLVGHKWIANKWIRSYGNEYHRPCGLGQNHTQTEIEPIMDSNRRNVHAHAS